MLRVLMKNSSKSDITRNEPLCSWGSYSPSTETLQSHPGMKLHFVELYWGYHLRRGLWCLFLDSCRWVAPSRVLCVCCVLSGFPGGTEVPLLSGWHSLVYLVCLTHHSPSLPTPAGRWEGLRAGYIYQTCLPVSLQRYVGLVQHLWPKGVKALGKVASPAV